MQWLFSSCRKGGFFDLTRNIWHTSSLDCASIITWFTKSPLTFFNGYEFLIPHTKTKFSTFSRGHLLYHTTSNWSDAVARRNTSLSRSRLGLLWFSISQSVSTLHSLASSRRPTRAHVQQHKSVPSTDPNDFSTYDQLVTPAFVAALYKIPPGTSKIRGNSLGIFESELQFYTKKGFRFLLHDL